jgi:hypothetical protein
MKFWLTIFMILCLLGNLYVNSTNLNNYTSDRFKQSSLTKGKKMMSKNGNYWAIIIDNGNLAIYSSKSINKKGYDNMIWSTNINTTSKSGDTKLVMKGDGDLVLLDNKNTKLWSTNTALKGKAPYSVIMQNDGNLVLYTSEGKQLWESKTSGKL